MNYKTIRTAFILAIGLCISPVTFAQTAPSPQLYLSSPAPGTSVLSGGVLTVTVDISPRMAVRMVSIAGSIGQMYLLNSSNAASMSSVPAIFTVNIPENSRIGKHTVFAIAVTSDGRTLQSQPIVVEITAPLDVTSMQSDFEGLFFGFRGQSGRLGIYVLDAQGVRRYIDDSMEISCVSSNTAIVRIIPPCKPVGISNGDALVTASYRGANFVVPIGVSIGDAKGDLNGDGSVDMFDIDLLTAMIGQRPLVTGDDRDLNSDGKIDALDVRILTTMCTSPRCATQ